MSDSQAPSRPASWQYVPGGLLVLLALLGYYGPWIRQRAAGLAWNAYDLFDLLRFLPQIEAGALHVNLHTLRLPLLGLGVLLPLGLAAARPALRWSAAAVGACLSAATLPPYPQILTAWQTPGWNAVLWWGLGGIAGAGLMAGFGARLGRFRPWVALAWLAGTGLPALFTLRQLLPALTVLHHTPVGPGWGAWLYGVSWLGLLLEAGWRGIQVWRQR